MGVSNERLQALVDSQRSTPTTGNLPVSTLDEIYAQYSDTKSCLRELLALREDKRFKNCLFCGDTPENFHSWSEWAASDLPLTGVSIISLRPQPYPPVSKPREGDAE